MIIKLSKIVLFVALISLISPPIYLRPAPRANHGLFETILNPPNNLPGRNAPAKRQRLVRINPSWLANSDKAPTSVGPKSLHTLKLFEDIEVTLVVDTTHFKEKGRFVLIGHIQGIKASTVILAFYRGALNGTVLMPGIGTFWIRSTAKGFTWIIETDPNVAFKCGVIPANEK